MTDERRIHTNLDTAEREEKKEPFTFVHSDREITLIDPADLDWRVLETLNNERDFLKAAMTEEDLQFFMSVATPMWKMEKLGRDYQKHYGIEEPGKAD